MAETTIIYQRSLSVAYPLFSLKYRLQSIGLIGLPIDSITLTIVIMYMLKGEIFETGYGTNRADESSFDNFLCDLQLKLIIDSLEDQTFDVTIDHFYYGTLSVIKKLKRIPP